MMDVPRAMPEEPANLYRIRGLAKTYGSGPGAVHALHDVDLDVRKGALIVMLGPSGSGKSTLLNILGGLDHASSGEAWFRDRDLITMDDDALTEYRRENIGFVFQFYNLIASLTARENVQLITDIASNPMRPEDALALVGLERHIDRFPAELSGGEQQRVAIARAVAKRPSVLLCDEPTGALDSKTGTHVLAALDHINREVGTTTLIITHNAVIADMADEVVRFHDGTIASVTRNPRRRPVSELAW
jgi:putative ABC transport system ATP-binding protein